MQVDIMNVPKWVEDVLYDYLSCEFSTISKDYPITLPLGPVFYEKEQGKVVVFTPPYAKRVKNIKKNPHVSMLFSSSKGSGLDIKSIVLVQGTAKVYDEDLEANFKKLLEYLPRWIEKEKSMAVLFGPGIQGRIMRKLAGFYQYRALIEVPLERVLAWKNGDLDMEPLRLEG